MPEVDESHAAGRRRAPAAADLNSPATLEEEISGEEPAALLDEDDAPQSDGASTWSAWFRPSSGFVEGLSFAFTCGGIPTSLIDVPFRVRY